MNEKAHKNKRMAGKLSLGALIMAVCFLIALPTLNAQQGQKDQQGYGEQQQQEYQYQDPSQQAADFSDPELKKFAAALSEVNNIRGEYSEALENVKDSGKAQELQNKYTKKMINAIEGKGLSVEDYNNISKAMQENPQLREKVKNMSN